MSRIQRIITIGVICLIISAMGFELIPASSAASSYKEYNGTLGSAAYVIRIPDPIENWNGDLVVACRGYMHDMIADPMLRTSSLYSSMTEGWSSAAISKGAAFAISNLGTGGYCVREGITATYELTQYVKTTFNVTGKIYVEGGSMGGSIALMLGYKYPNLYSGVLDICGSKNTIAQYSWYNSLSAISDDGLVQTLSAVGAPSPPYPFTLYPASMWANSFRNWAGQAATDMVTEFGGTPSAVPEAYRELDPLYHANISIPVITVHGNADALVPYSRSLDYQNAIAAANKTSLYRLYAVNGGEHVSPSVLIEGNSHLSELIDWVAVVPEGWGIVTLVGIAGISVALCFKKKEEKLSKGTIGWQ
jgi:pimeloyl-ACP methyl ester carboxylesterase